MVFKYKAKNNQGKTVSGLVESNSEKQAITLLRSQGLFIISLTEKKTSPLSSLNLTRFRKINFSDIVDFTTQLSMMVNAGLSLADSLGILKAQVSNPAFSKIISELLQGIEGGSNFADCLAKYPQHFSQIYVSLIRAGEASGKLPEVLQRLSVNLEKQREFRSKIKGALIYPIIIIIAMVVVIFIMMTVVIPKIAELYKDFNKEFPLPTKILISISDFFVHFWWLMLIFLGCFVIFFRSWKKTLIGRYFIDRLILKLPIWGNLKKQMILSEFTRTLGILVGSGIPILQALEIVADSLDNIIFQDDLKVITKQVEKGFPLGLPISQNPHFPPIIGQMVIVGEETGKLDETLLKLSIYLEAGCEQGIKILTAAIEPLIMVLLGIGVGFVVISIVMPIYSLTSQF